MESAAIYMSAMSMCLLLTAALYICNLKNWKTGRWHPLAWIYMFTMVCCAADVLWVLVEGKPELTAWNYIIDMIEFSCFGGIGYSWYFYCCESFSYPWWRSRQAKILLAIPYAVVLVLIFTTWAHGWLFTIDENGCYQRGPYFFLQQVGYFYLVPVTVLALLSRRKTRFTVQRRWLTTITLFAVSPILFGGLQLLAPPAVLPTLQFSILISLILLFSNECEQKITHDSLTKLINRFELERLMDEKMTRFRKSDQTPFYVIVGDLDDFKHINDSFGHMTGDRALQFAAHAIHTAAHRYDAVASRMSGDEFCVLLTAQEESTVPELIRDIEHNLQQSPAGEKFTVSMSLGYACYNGSETLFELLDRADDEMYRIKKEKKLRQKP